jgi:hypothetical protein
MIARRCASACTIARMAGPLYSGIGSRDTPREILAAIGEIASRQARAGWVLRTGGSPGADQAFAAAALAAGGQLELYLPWPGFEREARRALEHESLARAHGSGRPEMRVLERPADAAFALAARFHPRWGALSSEARALLARDAHEVLGAGLGEPSQLVVCWTADGSLDGEGLLDDGTGQALRIAAQRAIPVLNLARAEHLALLG